jgi:hypothetical protein
MSLERAVLMSLDDPPVVVMRNTLVFSLEEVVVYDASVKMIDTMGSTDA